VDDPALELPVGVPDRTAVITFLGVLQIVLGVLAVMMVPMQVASQAMVAHKGLAPLGMLIFSAIAGAGLYLLAATLLIWTGVGLLRGRRWASAVSLVVSWLWLMTGLVSILMVIVSIPAVISTPMPDGKPMPPHVATVLVLVSLGITTVMFLVLPGVLVFFHSRPAVRANFEHLDKGPCWTDSCPLPVLGYVFLMAIGVLGLLVSLPVAVLPLWGRLLTGWPARGVAALLLAGQVWLTLGVFRLKRYAWWAALAWHPFWIFSCAATLWIIEMKELYGALGYAGKHLDALEPVESVWGVYPWMLVLVGVLLIGYQIWMLKYFKPEVSAE